MLLIATFALSSLPQATAGEKHQSGVQSENLLKASSYWDGEPYKYYPSSEAELSIVKINLEPHGTGVT